MNRPTASAVTDGVVPDERPLTPQPDGFNTAMSPNADTERAVDPRLVGGGGVGWLQPTDSRRLVIVALPGGIGGGVAVPVDVAAGADERRGRGDVLRRRSESAEGPRAVGVAAAVLALLVAASGCVWALYKFKPGLVRDEPEVDIPIYAVDKFLDTYRPPTPPKPTSPGALSDRRVSTLLQSGINTPSQTALNAANWNNYINELSSLFSTQLTAAGSGIAGLMAGAAAVTRGTQTDLIGAGLGPLRLGNLRNYRAYF